jgi:hypothetical protein
MNYLIFQTKLNRYYNNDLSENGFGETIFVQKTVSNLYFRVKEFLINTQKITELASSYRFITYQTGEINKKFNGNCTFDWTGDMPGYGYARSYQSSCTDEFMQFNQMPVGFYQFKSHDTIEIMRKVNGVFLLYLIIDPTVT